MPTNHSTVAETAPVSFNVTLYNMKVSRRRYFYKFKSLDADSRQNTLKILREGVIYFPKFSELNDPHDGKIYFNNTVSKGEIIRLYQWINKVVGQPQFALEDLFDNTGRLIKERVVQLFRVIENTNDMFSKYGTLCLCETCTNPVMWAHYSKNSGICIEFDGMGTILQDPEYNYRIKYSKNYPTIKITDFACDEKSVVKRIFATKYKDWKYEKEWRLINGEGGKEWELPAKISSVIFGLNTDKKYGEIVKEIEKIASQAAINLKVVFINKKKYEYGLKDHK